MYNLSREMIFIPGHRLPLPTQLAIDIFESSRNGVETAKQVKQCDEHRRHH
jgi:hypothetical protein